MYYTLHNECHGLLLLFIGEKLGTTCIEAFRFYFYNLVLRQSDILSQNGTFCIKQSFNIMLRSTYTRLEKIKLNWYFLYRSLLIKRRVGPMM